MALSILLQGIIAVASARGATLADVDVHYFVVEEGQYTQAQHGVKMEAVKYASTVTDYKNSWVGESRTYQNDAYTSPVVMGQVMTCNDPDFSVFWCMGAAYDQPPDAATLYTGKHVGQDTDLTRLNETIGYVVVESGAGAIGGLNYTAAVGSNIVCGMDDSPPFVYTLGGLSAAAVGVVDIAGMHGGDGGWALLYGDNPLTATTMNLATDEDQIADAERNHWNEYCGYMVFETPGAAPFAECGVASGVNSDGWTTVHLTNSYDSMVVACTPNYGAGEGPGVVRVRNASGSTFEVRVDPAVNAPFSPEWPEHAEQFPAMDAADDGDVWLAVLERPLPVKRIRIDRIHNVEQTTIGYLQPENMTGIGPPAVAALDNGCVAAFAFERDDRWRIACAFIDAQTNDPVPWIEIPTSANSNIAPVVATVGDLACVLWESNFGDARGIYACWVDPDTGPGFIQRLSAADANSYNPAVVALPGGSLFAAWDSVRDHSANIYGARFHAGVWESEQRLTTDGRIERHPELAARGAEVWMAWQAQYFNNWSSNNMANQRIAVARVGESGLEAPLNLFTSLSPSSTLLCYPRIAFDPQGRLWVSAHKGRTAGTASWDPMVWCYDGDSWTSGDLLYEQYGRWQPIPLAFSPTSGALAAVQYDNLPEGWYERGIWPDWDSGVGVVQLPAVGDPAPAFSVEPLTMPATTFSVADKMQQAGAELPRQQWDRPGGTLTLYWGDLHCHTDLSVCNRKVNPPGHDSFATHRDIERLDFASLNDHGYNHDHPQWSFNGEQTRNNYDPGRFITFLGEEWTSSVGSGSGGYGHRNLIFLDPYHDKFYDSYDDAESPAELWTEVQADGAEFITIPHELADWKGQGSGNPPTDWNYTDEFLQPLAEIFQQRGSYEYYGCPRQDPNGCPFPGNYLQDAWAREIIIGTIASPDHGGGRGKAGVWAEDLTRESLFEAMRARHTFGTSGPKMAMRFSAEDVMMGDKVQRPIGAAHFTIEGAAERTVSEVVVFRNNQIVYTVNPGATQFTLQYTDPAPPAEDLLWYYARFMTSDSTPELAWSSPIWFTRPDYSVVWVDFAHDGLETGSEDLPVNSVADALSVVDSGGTIKLKPGESGEIARIDQPVRLEAAGGAACLGVAAP